MQMKPKRKHSSETDSPLSQQLQLAMKDMHQVEAELDAQLAVLGSKVDDGFKQLQHVNKAGMTIARTLLARGHKKYAMGVIGIGFALSGIAGVYSGVKAARAHNRALDRLLEQKKKIARTKIHSLLKVEEIARRNEAALRNLFEKESSQTYQTSSLLENKKNRRGITDNLLTIINLYKISLYNMYMVEFILNEYRAWNDGRQRSGTKRPVMSMVNNEIYKRLTNGGNRKYVENLLAYEQSSISGGDICFLADNSLSSAMLVEHAFCHSRGVEHLKGPKSAIAKRLMKPNVPFRLYRRSERLLWFFGEWPVLVTMGVIFASLFAFLDYKCYGWWSEWIPYIKWIALIVLGVLEIIVLAISLFAYDCNFDRIRESICRRGKMKQLRIMGYVEIYEPDLEKKNLLWAGTKGFISGLISI